MLCMYAATDRIGDEKINKTDQTDWKADITLTLYYMARTHVCMHKPQENVESSFSSLETHQHPSKNEMSSMQPILRLAV